MIFCCFTFLVHAWSRLQLLVCMHAHVEYPCLRSFHGLPLAKFAEIHPDLAERHHAHVACGGSLLWANKLLRRKRSQVAAREQTAANP